MKRKRAKHREEPWPLAKLRSACSSAPVVWLALCDLAAERGTSVLTPTRELLVTLTGIVRRQTISEALTTLAKAGWVDRTIVPSFRDGTRKTLLRVTLRRKQRKSLHTGKTLGNENRCIRRGLRKQRKSLLDSYYVREARHKEPPPPSDESASAGREEHPSVRIEREKLEAIRAERAAEQQCHGLKS